MRLHEWLQYRAINVISLLRTPCRVVDYIKPDLDHIRAQLPVSLYSASESGDGCHGPSYKKIWGLTSLSHVLHLPLRALCFQLGELVHVDVRRHTTHVPHAQVICRRKEP